MQFDVLVVHTGDDHIVILRFLRIKMYFFQDLRDTHRGSVESALVVAIGQMADVSVLVGQNFYVDGVVVVVRNVVVVRRVISDVHLLR